MEEMYKRLKITKESTIDDIASSISEISASVASLSEKYRAVLKINKAVVLCYQSIKEHQKESSIEQIQSELEGTRIDKE